MQDELHSLELELSQLEIQNDNLKTDNAALLQRWIHAKTEEARKMNEANAFLEEAKRIRAGKATVAADDREGSVSGDGAETAAASHPSVRGPAEANPDKRSTDAVPPSGQRGVDVKGKRKA